jgi:hypothetical protein
MNGRLLWVTAAALVMAFCAVALSKAEKGAAAEKGTGTAAPPAPKPAGPAASKNKPLLLLDDEPETKPGGPVADNSRCHVCHVNFEKEPLAVDHARANVGCAKCHGTSDAHIADESWTWGGKGTPPDKMYVSAKVNPLCLGCHEMNAREPHKCRFPELPQKKLCTDCHGKHRLAKRKCHWK